MRICDETNILELPRVFGIDRPEAPWPVQCPVETFLRIIIRSLEEIQLRWECSGVHSVTRGDWKGAEVDAETFSYIINIISKKFLLWNTTLHRERHHPILRQ